MVATRAFLRQGRSECDKAGPLTTVDRLGRDCRRALRPDPSPLLSSERAGTRGWQVEEWGPRRRRLPENDSRRPTPSVGSLEFIRHTSRQSTPKHQTTAGVGRVPRIVSPRSARSHVETCLRSQSAHLVEQSPPESWLRAGNSLTGTAGARGARSRLSREGVPRRHPPNNTFVMPPATLRPAVRGASWNPLRCYEPRGAMSCWSPTPRGERIAKPTEWAAHAVGFLVFLDASGRRTKRRVSDPSTYRRKLTRARRRCRGSIGH